MQKYPKYKSSGIDWLGEIPEHWEMLPGLSFIYENKERNTGMIRDTVLSLSYGNIRIRQESELTGLVPESFETYQLVNKGDLIFRPTDLQNDKVSLRSSISNYEGIITSAYLNLRFKETADPKFFHYFFRAIDNNKVIYGLGSGLRQNISYLDFKRFRFVFPPLPEQKAIAEFLDDKTAKIDEAVCIKEKEIELLKERRQIIIQEVVTGKKVFKDGKWQKPDKTKPGGLDWIGEIPEDWEVRKLKFYGKMYSGLSGKSGEDFSNDFKDGYSPYIPFTNIFNNNVINENLMHYVSINSHERQNIVKNGDLLFLMSSETIEDIGKNALYNGKEKVFLNSFCKGFRISKTSILPEFLNFLLLSNSYREYFSIVGRGFTRINIKQEYILNLPILEIPIYNQKIIIDFLKETESKINQAISIKEQEMEKLKEYKTVLIDHVVTGRIKVS